MDRTWRIVGAMALSFALLGAACGSGTGTGGSAYGGGGGVASSPAGATGSTGGGGGYHSGYGSGGGTTGATGSTGGAGVLTVTQVNYQFSPPRFTISSGDTITVSDTNPQTPHTFTVQGTSIDITNDPQQSQDVTIDLKPGTYTFFCRFHRSLGMTGTLIVK